MSKRFTETRKWQNTWFMDLPAKYKLSWIWILDNCDHAGLIDANPRLISFMVGEPIDGEEMLRVMAGRITKPKAGKWFIPSFINFQYGDELNSRNSAHRGVLRILREQGIACPVRVSEKSEAPEKPLQSPSAGAKDKDKDKDKDGELKLEDEKQAASDSDAITPEQIYSAYPRKENRPSALRAIQKALLGQDMSAERLLGITQAYAQATDQWPKDERKFIPHPASWFNGERYRDDPKEWQENAIPESEKSEYNEHNAW